MSKSILEFNGKFLAVNDTVLQLALYFLIEEAKKSVSPKWFDNYHKKSISAILDVKPVGWADLHLDVNLNSFEKREYFCALIKKTVSTLKIKQRISTQELNSILKMKEKEGFELKKREFPTALLIDFLSSLFDFVQP